MLANEVRAQTISFLLFGSDYGNLLEFTSNSCIHSKHGKTFYLNLYYTEQENLVIGPV